MPLAGGWKRIMGNSSSTPRNKTGKRVVAQKLETAQKTNVLSLTEHKLDEIPEQVFRITSLRTLDLSKNNIRSLGKISQLKELKSLNCDENALASRSLIPLSNLSKLTILSMGKNRLENPANQTFPSLPPQCKQYPGCLYAKCFSRFCSQLLNRFMQIVRWALLNFTLDTAVKQLKLSGNSFLSIPKQICDPKLPLEKLDLSFNNLAAIPAEIRNLVALTELNLDNNVIVSLPEEIGHLKKLKTLSLKNNYIQVRSTNFSFSNPQPLPKLLFENTLLIDFNLHGNKLTSTQLNEFEGFDLFLERRKKVKTKNLHGGALVDMSVCGLK